MAEYDAIAADYAALVDGAEPIVELSDTWIRSVMGPVDGQRICDFGCVPEELSRRLAREGAHVTAMDVSPRLIAAA